jgi:hypothetical protein
MVKIIFGIIFLLLSSGIVQAAELSPEQIVAKSWEQFRNAKGEKETVKIVVVYADGRKEEKKLFRWTKFDSGSEDQITLKFFEPPLDRGLGLLTLRHPVKEDEQWLKLPSLKKVRKIAVGEQEKYFAGTDFTNEDVRQLIGEKTKDFTYRLVNKTGNVWTIEAVPKSGVETGYGRRVFQIDDKMVFLKIDYFGKNGEHIKTQTNSNIVFSKGNLWRANHVEVNNFLLKRKTVVDVESRDIDPQISPNIFAKDFLESERM